MDLRFDMFAVVFALGTINHELQFILEQQRVGPFGEYMERWGRVKPSIGWSSEVGVAIHLADVVISVLILVLPYRRELTCLLAPFFLLSQLVSLERIPAHNSLMDGVLAIVLILGLAEVVERVCRRQAAGAPGTDWYGWTLTGLTWMAALTYILAFFQKLNPKFLSPSDSSARLFILPYVNLLGVSDHTAIELLGYPMVVLPLLLEASLPFLLFCRRTRLLGFFLGLTFHLPMLGQGVMDFPPQLLAIYPAFMTATEARVLLERFRARPSVPRLASTLVLCGIGFLTIPAAGHTSDLYSSRTQELLLVYAHHALLYVSFVFFVYVLATVAGQLFEPAFQQLAARRRSARGLERLPA